MMHIVKRRGGTLSSAMGGGDRESDERAMLDESDRRRIVVKGDKFKIARIMADAGIPFIFVKEAGYNTVGDVPKQHLDKLSKLLDDKPELEGRFAKRSSRGVKVTGLDAVPAWIRPRRL